MLVIDSQGDVIERLRRLKCFADSNRLLVVDAADVEPVCLNIFDMPKGREVGLSQREREQAFAARVDSSSTFARSLM